MKLLNKLFVDIPLLLIIVVLIIIGLLLLGSTASFVFPQYFVYIVVAVAAFLVFINIDFHFLTAFSGALYVGSIALLILPIFLGEVTRGAVRWIPIGSFTLQPAEFVRPFLILFFAQYILNINRFTLFGLVKLVILAAVPLFLIFMQPSLGVTVLTACGIGGVFFARKVPVRAILYSIIGALLLLPVVWFVLAPYQKSRVMALIAPSADPSGAGYNSIQSMIAVGAGQLSGRGLGKGVQTQLSFLPEKHTDFMFASTSEELGLIGALLLLSLEMVLVYRILNISENIESGVARGYTLGVFMTLFVQITVHVGMNMGLFPITGLPLPLVSYGGSSLLSTMIMLAIVLQAKLSSATIQPYEIRSYQDSGSSI